MVAKKAEQISRSHQIERVLWLILVLNLAVSAAKYFYGLATGSAAMQADGIHSVFDSLGNVIGLVGVSLAARPADSGHPYGHAKFETYASLAIGCLLVFAAFEVGGGAVGRLMSGAYTAEVSSLSFAVMLATLVVNISVTLYERYRGKQLNSDILVADAMHTLSDVFVSLGVVVSLIFVACGYPVADPIMALIVTVFIIFSAVNVFRSAFRILSDHARINPEEIQKLALEFPDIVELHCVRSRGTEAEVYCDLHLLVDPRMTVLDAHRLGDAFEECVKQEFSQVKEVLVHIEPFGYDESAS